MTEKKKRKNKVALILFILSATCFVTALGGLCYNLWLIRKVEMESAKMLEELFKEESSREEQESGTESLPPEESKSEGESAEESVEESSEESSGLTPHYVLDPNEPMPTKRVNGKTCIGILRIPQLKIEYPIISTWNYTLLESAPCRFHGSVYSRDIIICAHNYTGSFGKIGKLPIGTEFTFTDMAGRVFTYVVTEIRNLSPDAYEEMIAGDWDMTLFTCTKGAKWRITVRCKLKE